MRVDGDPLHTGKGQEGPSVHQQIQKIKTLQCFSPNPRGNPRETGVVRTTAGGTGILPGTVKVCTTGTS